MEDAATMTSTRSSKIKSLLRHSDSFFDVIGLRPVGIVVFAASTILFFYLIGLSAGTIHADGVAVAGRVDHPAPVSSFVTRVFVKRGDRVEVGMSLVELSPDEIDQDLARTDFEIEQLTHEAGLANTRSSDTVAPGEFAALAWSRSESRDVATKKSSTYRGSSVADGYIELRRNHLGGHLAWRFDS